MGGEREGGRKNEGGRKGGREKGRKGGREEGIGGIEVATQI